jgi:L-aspartate oxidase
LGERVAHGVSEFACHMPDNFSALPISEPPRGGLGETLDLWDIRNSLTSLMWRAAGVRRTREGLLEAAESVDSWRRYVLVRQFHDPEGWELQNMLTVARIVIGAALAREESRGVHLRTDFPATNDDSWRQHLTFREGRIDPVLAPLHD